MSTDRVCGCGTFSGRLVARLSEDLTTKTARTLGTCGALVLLAALCVCPQLSLAQDFSPSASGGEPVQHDSPAAESAATASTASNTASDSVGGGESQADDHAEAETAAPPSEPASLTAPIDPSTGKPLDQPLLHNFAGQFLHDQYHMWRGPFRSSNYDGRTMKKYGIPFLVISAALIATDRETAKFLPNTTSQVIWSGRVSQMGAPYTLAGFAGLYYGIGRATGNEHARETGFLALEALGDSQLIGVILKEITQRQRPYANNIRGAGFWRGGSSFPSGHALGSFSVASVFAYEYRNHLAVPIVAYSLATVVDLSRFGARAHWYSDVFVGSSMGFLIGRYVYKNHHDSELPGSPVVPPVKRASRLRPALGGGPQGVGLYWYL